MSVARRTRCFAAAACLLATQAPAQTPPAQVRSELRALGASLDGAVRRVSRVSHLASSGTTRSYLMPGIGVVFVLPPRALPVGSPRGVASPALRVLVDASRQIERSLKSARSPEERARLEQTLRALRESQAQWRQSSGFALQMHSGPEGEVTVQTMTLEPDGAALSEAQPVFQGSDQEGRGDLERPFREMLAQAEQFRSEAEKARAEAELLLRQRLQERGGVSPPAAPPKAPEAPSPPAAPEAIQGPEWPPAPPWEIFFDFGEPQDTRTPEAVIQEVRQAVMGTLAAQGGRLSGVRPEEQVVVAVDFLPSLRTRLRAAPERTLVIRVPKKDLDDLKASRLSSENFLKRVQTSEY